MKPVHSPAPLSTAPPAGTGRAKASSASTSTVTPVRATPRPSGGAGSSRTDGRVPEADAGDVEDGVGGTGRERPDHDPQVASARHGRHPASTATSGTWLHADSCACRSPSCGRPTTRRHEPMREVWVGVPTAGTEVPERVDRILDAAARPHELRRGRAPTTTTCCGACTTRRSSTTSRTVHDEWMQRAVRRAGRPGPGRALRLPDPGDDPGHAADRAGGDARPGRAVLLRHDDAGRPRHLGGRPRRRRLRPDRGRPGRRRARAHGVRPLPPARAPRHAATGTAAPATSTTRRSPPRRCATPATSGSRSSTSTRTTATAPQAIF